MARPVCLASCNSTREAHSCLFTRRGFAPAAAPATQQPLLPFRARLTDNQDIRV
jgi:hypothetical protein